jgi:hypothetical protein
MGNSNINDLLAQKLPELELRRLAEADTDQKVNVIVELDLPPQEVFFSKNETGRATGAFIPKGVVEETPAQRKKKARKIEKAHDFLESLLGTAPHWLRSARAFVVTVTPEQLREIAQSSLTKTIRLNRHLQKTS